MRLADLAQIVAQYGAKRYLEKRANIGMALPMGVGMGLAAPSIVGDVRKTYRNDRNRLDRAALETLVPEVASGFKTGGASEFFQSLAGGMQSVPLSSNLSTMGGAMAGPMVQGGLMPLLEAPGRGIGNRVERALSGREFGERQDPLRMLGQSTITALGKGMGQIGADLLKDMATKAMAATRNIRNDSARTAIIDQLKREDPVLHDADNGELMEAYHTMTRFAPVLSTDKNAVRSFLRQAVMSGTGPDYITIKLLAESEAAIKGYKPGSKRDPWI